MIYLGMLAIVCVLAYADALRFAASRGKGDAEGGSAAGGEEGGIAGNPHNAGHAGGAGYAGREAGGKLLLSEAARRWVWGWLALQAAGAGVWLSGIGPRTTSGFFFYYAALSLVLPFALMAGVQWAGRAGTPTFRDGAAAGERRIGGAARRRKLLEFALLAGAGLATTLLLFGMVRWSSASELKSLTGAGGEGSGNGGGMTLALPALLYLLVSAAVSEELLFRHYLLNRLVARFRNVWLPAALVTAAWAVGHGGMVEPAWVKYTQVAVYGALLSAAQLRLGTGAAIALHLVFNLATPLLAKLVGG